MRLTCNMIGSTHCGREITSEDVARTGIAHIHRGDQPHELRTMFQCRDCVAKEEAVKSSCDPKQATWMERRRALDMSMGEMARKLRLGSAVYSGLEHLKQVAPAAVIEEVESTLKYLESEQAPTHG